MESPHSSIYKDEFTSSNIHNIVNSNEIPERSTEEKGMQTRENSPKQNNQIDLRTTNRKKPKARAPRPTLDVGLGPFFKKARKFRDQAWVGSSIKLFVNSTFLLLFLAGVLTGAYIMYADVNKKIAVEVATELSKKKGCEKAYRLNNCHKADVGPALEEFCLEKELCMYIDPKNKVLTTQMIGGFLAEVVNYTITPLSTKTIIIIFLSTIGIIFVWNVCLNLGTPAICKGCHMKIDRIIQEQENPTTPTKMIQSCNPDSNCCGGCEKTYRKGGDEYTEDGERSR